MAKNTEPPLRVLQSRLGDFLASIRKLQELTDQIRQRWEMLPDGVISRTITAADGSKATIRERLPIEPSRPAKGCLVDDEAADPPEASENAEQTFWGPIAAELSSLLPEFWAAHDGLQDAVTIVPQNDWKSRFLRERDWELELSEALEATVQQLRNSRIVHRKGVNYVLSNYVNTVGKGYIIPEWWSEAGVGLWRRINNAILHPEKEEGKQHTNGQTDTDSDTKKRKTRRRQITAEAVKCGRYVRQNMKLDPTAKRDQLVKNWVELNGGSESSLYRTLTDWPHLYEPDDGDSQ